MRGGLVIGSGILAGNVFGFLRSAVTAYLLGTRLQADSLAVALGPIDTLNGILINTMVFAFVPVFAAREGCARAKIARRTVHLFAWVFSGLCVATLVFAKPIVDVIGPGLPAPAADEAAAILRICALSVPSAGIAGLYSALLYTERRFAPSAFHQALINLFVIAGALLLWNAFGIYAMAAGYVAGSLVQLAIVLAFAARSLKRLDFEIAPAGQEQHGGSSLLAQPAWFLLYATSLSANMLVTRAFATQAGPGMAAAFDYCTRCVNVLAAYLISPVSNALLPEIARLRNSGRARQAFRLIDRSLLLTGLAAVLATIAGIAVREPVIALLFQRGSFTGQSTRLVAGVFLGFVPSLTGWVLLEIASRSLFALNRPVTPNIAAAMPFLFNLIVCLILRPRDPIEIGLGSAIGLAAGFAVLLGLLFANRGRWSKEFHSTYAET